MRYVYPSELRVQEISNFQDVVHKLVGKVQPRIDKLEFFGGLPFEHLSKRDYFVEFFFSVAFEERDEK